MKNFLCILLTIVTVSSFSFAQDKISINNPISRIDYFFDEDNNLQIFAVFNSDTNSATAQLIKASLTGVINWDGQAKPQTKFIAQLSAKSEKNEYRYQAIIEDENNIKIKLPATKNATAWKNLDNIRLILTFESSTQSYQLIPMYSKLNTTKPPLIPKLQIEPIGSIISDNEAVVKIKTQPEVSFEILSINMQKGSSQFAVPMDKLNGQNKTWNGLLNLPIPFSDISLKEEGWLITISGKTLKDEIEIKTEATNVFLRDEKLISILPPIATTTHFTSDEDVKDVNINTQGKGTVGVEIISPGLKQILKYNITNSGSLYTLKFSNLKNVNDEVVDFWVTSNNIRIGNPFKLIKRKATISDFAFDLSKSDIIAIHFSTPDWANENSLSLTIPDRGINIGAQNMTFKKSLNTPLQVTCQLNDFIKGKFNENDTVINANIVINYANQPLYNASVRFINQKLIDKKINELIAVTTEEKRPKKEKIQQVLEDIVKIAGTVGTTVSNEDVQKAINELSETNNSKEKVSKAMNTISTVGKWFTKLGPIVLPLLL